MIEINLTNKDGVFKTIVLDPERQIWQFDAKDLKVYTQESYTGYRLYFEMKSKQDGHNLLRKIGTNTHWHVIYLYADQSGKLSLSPNLEFHEEN